MEVDYKIGDVVLFNHTGSIFTKLITKYNLSNYGESKCTHAGIITKVLKNSVTINEPITYSGIRAYEYDKKYLKNKIKENYIIIRRPKKKLINLKANADKYLNIKYGILDILAIGFYWLTKLKISLTKTKRLICSEYVVRVLYDSSNKKINFEKEYNKHFDLITPMDIYKSKFLEEI